MHENEGPLTRAECDEIVKRPGKFEGAQPWAPYFWAQALEGLASYDEGYSEEDNPIEAELVSVFETTAADRALFPELADVTCVRIWEDGQGFVYTKELGS